MQICDCCDGSDEAEGVCPNTCAVIDIVPYEMQEIRRSRLAGIEKDLSEATKGNALLHQRVEENNTGVGEIANAMKDIMNAKEELKKLKEKVQSRGQISFQIDTQQKQ